MMIVGIAFALGRRQQAPTPVAGALSAAPIARPSAAASASNRQRNPLYPPSPGR